MCIIKYNDAKVALNQNFIILHNNKNIFLPVLPICRYYFTLFQIDLNFKWTQPWLESKPFTGNRSALKPQSLFNENPRNMEGKRAKCSHCFLGDARGGRINYSRFTHAGGLLYTPGPYSNIHSFTHSFIYSFA